MYMLVCFKAYLLHHIQLSMYIIYNPWNHKSDPQLAMLWIFLIKNGALAMCLKPCAARSMESGVDEYVYVYVYV